MPEPALPARTRIAPSPTGDPHVGTAYMALFNRALADRTGGQFIVRLDDTDQKRFDQTSERQIFDVLRWLDIRCDEGPDVGGPHAPYRQSERLDIYRRYLQRLLDGGHAYRCFCTAERLDTIRKIASREGKPTGYDRKCRDLPPDEVKRRVDAGEPNVVRVKMPLSGDVAFEDVLRGTIKFPAADLDDKVVWKADGFPTYHIANVVDDHEFRITHILRGEEWISSVPLHIVMIDALKLNKPVMCHMPLLRNADRSKVSKRKNPTSLIWFRDCGFIPEGMKNYLALMGFALPGDQEIFTYKEFVEHFALDRINTSGPVFDLKKIEWCNGEQMRRLAPAEFERRLIAHLKLLAGREAGFAPLPPDDPAHEKGTAADVFRLAVQERNRTIAANAANWLARPELIAKLAPLLHERLHTLSEAADYLPPFFVEMPALPVAEFDGLKKFSRADAVAAIVAATELVENSPLDPPALEAGLREICDKRGWKVGPPFMAVRLAALRARISPPLFESMAVLGKDLTLARLRAAAQELRG